MKKRVVSLGLATMMALSLTACGAKEEAAPVSAEQGAAAEAAAPAPAKDAKIIKFSLSQAATEPAPLAAQAFAEELAEKSGGSLVVEVYPDNQLGSERDVIEGLQLHTVEMVDPANAVVTNFIPELSIFELPMLFENKEHVYAVLDDIGMTYADLCEEQGFKLLGWFDMGSRHIMTVKKPINSIDDLKGLKIRTQEAAGNMAQVVELAALCGDKIDIYSGEDALTVPMMAMGAAGAISVLSNVVPAQSVAMTDAALSGDFATAAAAQCKMLPLINALFSEVNPIPAKAAVSAMGFGEENIRLPLTLMEETTRAKLYEEMRKLGVQV